MNYDLNRLNPIEFEHLIQSLLKKIIGQGTITFGQGPDGGREATYEGIHSLYLNYKYMMLKYFPLYEK
jgi:hypothetical protein